MRHSSYGAVYRLATNVFGIETIPSAIDAQGRALDTDVAQQQEPTLQLVKRQMDLAVAGGLTAVMLRRCDAMTLGSDDAVPAPELRQPDQRMAADTRCVLTLPYSSV
jgi:hypothetical protein